MASLFPTLRGEVCQRQKKSLKDYSNAKRFADMHRSSQQTVGLLCIVVVAVAGCASRPQPRQPREPSVAKTIHTPSVEIRSWHQGEAPIRLIRKDQGFCALSLVTGGFAGGGEIVKVWIGPDDYWYLGGQSQQEGVGAECIVVRYR